MTIEDQNMPLENMTFWHKDYYTESIILRNSRQEKLWRQNLSFPFVREINIYKRNLPCKGIFLSVPGKMTLTHKTFLSKEKILTNLGKKLYPCAPYVFWSPSHIPCLPNNPYPWSSKPLFLCLSPNWYINPNFNHHLELLIPEFLACTREIQMPVNLLVFSC